MYNYMYNYTRKYQTFISPAMSHYRTR